MFSMPGQVSTEAPAVKYPDIPELSVREKLMLEKEAAGMYFSGSLLDEYSRHIETMQFDPISMAVGEDADPVDRAAMKTVGIITSVTVKGTKNGKRMAFFTLEDRTAEIECIVFPNIFEELSPLLVRDNAVLVRGTISLREEEDAKLLVQTVDELVENNKFDPATVKPLTSAQKSTTYVQKTPVKEEKTPVSIPNIKDAKRLFLRVPDAHCEEFFKAQNLLEILEGDFPAFFFYANEKRYETTPLGVSLTPYLLEQLYLLLGRENVILK
jgi:DNA polymerase-3 subunit alpha